MAEEEFWGGGGLGRMTVFERLVGVRKCWLHSTDLLLCCPLCVLFLASGRGFSVDAVSGGVPFLTRWDTMVVYDCGCW